MIFDKNAERLRALEKKLMCEPENAGSIRKKIDALHQAGPEYWAAWYDKNGTKRREKPAKNTRQAAEQLERKRRCEVEDGTFDCPEDKRVTVEKMTEYFVEYKNNSADTRSLCKRINAHLGNVTLQRLDMSPTILVDHFRRFPEKDWSAKSIWNYYLKLKATIQFWIDMHRLQVVNPCRVLPKLVSTLRPSINIREVRPSHEDFNRLMVACVECNAPNELIDLFTAVKESGLRIGEVIRWQCEDFHLSVVRSDHGIEVPYYRSTISKRGRPVSQEMPMRRALYDVMMRVIGDRTHGPVWSWKNPPYKMIKQLGVMDRAGLTHLRTFHDYRKSFKTEMKIAGASSEISMYLQGHATESMDKYYTQYRRTDAQYLFEKEYEELLDNER